MYSHHYNIVLLHKYTTHTHSPGYTYLHNPSTYRNKEKWLTVGAALTSGAASVVLCVQPQTILRMVFSNQ